MLSPSSIPARSAAWYSLSLVALAAFVLLFWSLLVNSGLLGYTLIWLAPLLGFGVPPVISLGLGPGPFGVVLTGSGMALGATYFAAAGLLWKDPRKAQALCYIAGVLSAPIGVVGVYVGQRVRARSIVHSGLSGP